MIRDQSQLFKSVIVIQFTCFMLVFAGSGYPRCEEIEIPMCEGIGYNMTKYPNVMNHEIQGDANLEVHQFWPLVRVNCSPDLKFFLCSMYAPICIEDYSKPLPVCRTVCERARAGCETIMNRFGFEWPKSLNCESLPKNSNNNELCMENWSNDNFHKNILNLISNASSLNSQVTTN